MDWAVFLMLSIGRHVKCDALASKFFDACVKNSDAALPV